MAKEKSSNPFEGSAEKPKVPSSEKLMHDAEIANFALQAAEQTRNRVLEGVTTIGELKTATSANKFMMEHNGGEMDPDHATAFKFMDDKLENAEDRIHEARQQEEGASKVLNAYLKEMQDSPEDMSAEMHVEFFDALSKAKDMLTSAQEKMTQATGLRSEAKEFFPAIDQRIPSRIKNTGLDIDEEQGAIYSIMNRWNTFIGEPDAKAQKSFDELQKRVSTQHDVSTGQAKLLHSLLELKNLPADAPQEERERLEAEKFEAEEQISKAEKTLSEVDKIRTQFDVLAQPMDNRVSAAIEDRVRAYEAKGLTRADIYKEIPEDQRYAYGVAISNMDSKERGTKEAIAKLSTGRESLPQAEFLARLKKTEQPQKRNSKINLKNRLSGMQSGDSPDEGPDIEVVNG